MSTQLHRGLGKVVINLAARYPITITDLSTVGEEENGYWGQSVIIATGSLRNLGKLNPIAFAW